MFTLSIAIIPVAIFMLVAYLLDNKQDREPILLLLLLFSAGCVAFFIASAMEHLMDFQIPSKYTILKKLYRGFFVCGLTEEFCKLSFLILLVWWCKSFNEYYDGIVYAVFVSMGFACVENLHYSFHSVVTTSTLVYRDFLTVPAHFLFAVLMGYYLAIAKFEKEHRCRRILQALAYPFIMHGTYNTLLFVIPMPRTSFAQVIGWAIFVGLVIFDIMLWRWSIQRIQRVRRIPALQ